MMDLMDMRIVITVICFISFLGIFLWAYSGRQKQRFDEAANLPFADDEMQARTIELNYGAARKLAATENASESKEFNNA